MPATPTLRTGARVVLLDQADRVLLIHAQDPDQPDHHWWELPGGGTDPGETPTDTAGRELAEETGILLDHIGPHLWDRETRFHYRGRERHRRERVYLARYADPAPTLQPKHTANEKAGLIEHQSPRPSHLPHRRPHPASTLNGQATPHSPRNDLMTTRPDAVDSIL